MVAKLRGRGGNRCVNWRLKGWLKSGGRGCVMVVSVSALEVVVVVGVQVVVMRRGGGGGAFGTHPIKSPKGCCFVLPCSRT